jgi:phospholipase C
MPRQEKGLRPTRPLKYAPYVDGTALTGEGKFRLTFGAGPDLGAQFHVTSGNRTDAPWTYTAEAGKSIADTWNTRYSAGVTDLTVHGPNGFLRRFRNPGTTAGPEVTARHNAATGNLDLTCTNAGGSTATLTVTNAYGGDPKRLTVARGATVTHSVPLTNSRRWYDVTVTASGAPDFVRRFAGKVETGAAGLSDPAILTDQSS